MTDPDISLKSSAWPRRLLDFLGLRRSMAAMLAMIILVGMGENMAERFLPIYLMALGGGALSVSFLNGMDNLLSALYSFPGGYLSDRLGYKRALLVFNLIAMAGYLIVIFIPAWWAVIAGAALFLSWSAISLPATMSLVAAVLPDKKRTMGVSMHSLVRRIPTALGPVVGGLLIAWQGEILGVRLAFVAALLLAVVALVIQQAYVEDRKGKGKAEANPLKLLHLMSPGFRKLLVADILVRFSEQIPYAFMAIWVINLNGLSPVSFGILTTIEMITAMLIYIPVAYLADRGSKKPYVTITFAFFTLFPLLLMLANHFWLFVVAFIIRGLKEFGEPTRKALIMDLAPEGQQAAMFGLYYLLRDVVVSLAAFSAGFLWNISPQVAFLTAFGFGLAGTLFFAFFGEDVSVQRKEKRA
ncbi:MAG TPA: MFS transporter [Anaerolineaceae bacterium]|nr:MFS transporter [Anaerolineaceae bacterium]HPN53155.1 MFS transporter [Anaerolineaceae bacterium]